MPYLQNILIALDQFIGSLLPGSYPFETISSRAFREGWAIEKLINKVFFWDENHCEESYWSGIRSRQDFLKVDNA